MTTTAQKRTDRVDRAAAGSGSFLDPPTYPTHTYGIVTDTNRRPDNRGSMSLTAALEENTWLSAETVAQARRIIKAWEPPPIDSEPIQEWIAQVLGYFCDCYKGADEGPYGRGPWAAESLTIDDDRDPLEHVDEHAGVHLIREFYPGFTPTAETFAGAYWGTKPVS